MNKILLIEDNKSKLNYIAESSTDTKTGRKYIGKLAGVAADLTHPTRNGRMYPQDLWENIMASEEYKEMMDNKICYGENDHPETRVDTAINSISICMNKMEIRESEGIVWAEFDILDTPSGHILKQLLDYGSKIGVSSRGVGDIIQRDVNGVLEDIIDPDTYYFYGFDAVIMPAVKNARPGVLESKNFNSLIESFKTQLDSADTIEDLERLQKITETVKLTELNTIQETISNKLDSLNSRLEESKTGGDDITASGTEILKLSKEIEKLTEDNNKLEESIGSKNITSNDLKSKYKESVTLANTLSKLLQESKKLIKTYESNLLENSEQLGSMIEKIKSDKQEYLEKQSTLNKEYKKLQETALKLEDNNVLLKEALRASELDLAKSNKMVESLKTSRVQSASEVKKLESTISKLQNNKKLYENNAQSNIEKYHANLQEKNDLILDLSYRYLSSACKLNGVSKKVVESKLPNNYTVDDVDKIISKQTKIQENLGQLPIDFNVKNVSTDDTKYEYFDRSREKVKEDEELENLAEMLAYTK